MNGKSVMDILKESMIKYSGGYDESMYTPQGGRSRLGIANQHNIDPKSMVIDTLSFANPAKYTINISGKNVETGEKYNSFEDGLSLPLLTDVSNAIQEFYSPNSVSNMNLKSKAVVELKNLLDSVGKEPTKKTNEDSLMRSKMMKALGFKSDEEYDAFLKFKKQMENR